LQPAIMAKCRNVPLARRRKFRAQPRLLSVGYATEFAQVMAPKTRAAVRDGARTGHCAAGALALRAILYEKSGSTLANSTRGFSDLRARERLPFAVACMRSSTRWERSCPAVISRLMSVIFSHHSAEYLPPIVSSPLRVNWISLYVEPRRHYVRAPIREGGGRNGA